MLRLSASLIQTLIGACGAGEALRKSTVPAGEAGEQKGNEKLERSWVTSQNVRAAAGCTDSPLRFIRIGLLEHQCLLQTMRPVTWISVSRIT